MRKQVFGRKFSRNTSTRRALFRSLIRELILNGKIVTTEAKALSVKGDLDAIFLRARKGGLDGRRRILADLGNDKQAVDFLYEEVVGQLGEERTSGFVSFVNLPPRKGDGAALVRMQIIGFDKKATIKTKKEDKKKEVKNKKETKKKLVKKESEDAK